MCQSLFCSSHIKVPECFSLLLYTHLCLFRVKDTLEEFLDRSDLPKVESLDEFPDDINISQAIAAWKCIVNYQDKVKQ